MKTITRILIFILFLSVFSCENQSAHLPSILGGHLELKEDSIFHLQNITLNGEWKFTPGVYSFEGNENTVFVSIPEIPNWNQFPTEKNGEADGFGIGTYQIQITLPKESPKLALHFLMVHSDCKVYQDSELIGEIGSIENNSHPLDRMPRIIDLKPSPSRTITLTLFIKNRFYQWGGLRMPPEIGLEENLKHKVKVSILTEAILAGGLLFLGLYQLGIYFTRRKVRGSLYFFIFCLIMFFQILTTGSQSLFLIVGKELSELIYKIDVFTQYTGVVSGLLYIHSLTKEYIQKNLIYALAVSFIIPICITLFGSIPLISRLHFYVLCMMIPILVIVFYLLIRYVWDKRSGYMYLGLSVILLGTTATNDIVLTLMNVTDPMYLHLGLLLFVFFQSLFLSKHISGEIVSAEIKFKDILFQLIQSEKLSSIGMTVTSVAHEISSPLSAVILTSDNIRENVHLFFKQLPEIGTLSKSTFPFLLSLVEVSMKEESLPTGSEFRARKSMFLNQLNTLQIQESESYAEIFANLGIREIPKEWTEILIESNSQSLAKCAEQIVTIIQGTQAIHTSANRAIKISRALQNFTHFDPKAEIKTIHLAESMQQILTILEGSMKHGIELRTKFANIPPIECYPDELNQVWTNMIQNAIQAMNGNGKLTIEINQTILKNNSFAYVSIEDTGTGVPKEIVNQIFDPFFTTKPIGQGTGLGLYISKQIIEKHKGIIDVLSTKGHTKFIVYIPYQKETMA